MKTKTTPHTDAAAAENRTRIRLLTNGWILEKAGIRIFSPDGRRLWGYTLSAPDDLLELGTIRSFDADQLFGFQVVGKYDRKGARG
jgi:hypothetical protein